MDHVWVVRFFGTFHFKPVEPHNTGQIFFQRHLCGAVTDTKLAHPGTSIPKKWNVAPQNQLFHIGRSKRLSTFGPPDFPIFLQHFAKPCKNNQKQLLDTFGGLWGVAREH